MAVGHDTVQKLDLVLKRLHSMGAPKVLSACIVLLALSDNIAIFTETYTFVELFSGEGWVSRVMKTAGHRGASLDILLGSQNHGQGKQDPFDLLTDAGFALALVTILNCRMDGALVLIGLLCSSFVAINRATNRRFPFSPLGDVQVRSVREGNSLTSRTCLLIWVIQAMGCSFILEQPRSSMLIWHPRIREVLRSIPKAFLAYWWMHKFGGLTAKRHLALSNAPTVARLDLGKICMKHQKKLAASSAKSAITYRSKSGKTAFKGSRFLKSTGTYPPGFGRWIQRLYPRFIAERVVDWNIPEEVLRRSTESFFKSLSWGDLWDDAELVSVLQYLRGSSHLHLGHWRDLFPTEM